MSNEEKGKLVFPLAEKGKNTIKSGTLIHGRWV